MESKLCKGCALTLPVEMFSPDRRTLDGLAPRCYSCKGIAPPGATTKMCIMCDTVKPLDGFHKDLQSPDLHRRICKKCGSKSAKNWNQTNPAKFRANVYAWKRAHKDATRASGRRHHLKITYGITPEQYWEMFDLQGRVCAICGRPPKTKHLHVDHDHKTGRVRGLLCSNCNTRLVPIIEHHPERIAATVAYLENPPYENLSG